MMRSERQCFPTELQDYNLVADVFLGLSDDLKVCSFAETALDLFDGFDQDGTYSVRFPGTDRDHIVSVTLTESLLYANSGSYGVWLTVLDRAYMKERRFRDQVNFTESKNPSAPQANPYDIEDGAHVNRWRHNILTGQNDAGFFLEDISEEELEAHIQRNMEANRPIVLGEYNVVSDGQLSTLRHAFSLLNYDSETKTVTIRDPFGGSILQPYLRDVFDVEGYLELPLNKLHRFERISFGQNNHNPEAIIENNSRQLKAQSAKNEVTPDFTQWGW